ncbi:MAG: PAS domain-containing protein [Chloroflexi bacterium]|nr:PAS domain-containing protein [Chloroflexota bacterium]
MTPETIFTLLESAPFGAYAMSVDQKILFWNKSAERILGYSAEQVVGKRCYEVSDGQHAGGFTAECQNGCPSIRYLRAGLVPAPTRLRMYCYSGDLMWVTVTPMIVTGLVKDAPLLVHMFADDDAAPELDHAGGEHVSHDLGGTTDFAVAQIADSISSRSRDLLTPRELEVLRLVSLGRETTQIALTLGISPHTVRNHVRNLRHKLNAATKLDAVVAAIRMGILNWT